jgi:hypothetical protein
MLTYADSEGGVVLGNTAGDWSGGEGVDGGQAVRRGQPLLKAGVERGGGVVPGDIASHWEETEKGIFFFTERGVLFIYFDLKGEVGWCQVIQRRTGRRQREFFFFMHIQRTLLP